MAGVNHDDIPIEIVREGVRLFEQGQLHETNSNNREAIKCYQKMMDISFPDPPVLNRIAYCHLMLNEVDKATETLRKSLEIDPDDTEALHNLSMLLIDKGEVIEAEKFTRRAMALDPNHHGHWKNLGNIMLKRGKYGEAIQALATSVGLAPEDYDTHRQLALAYIRVVDLDNAHREFQRAIELHDEDGELLTEYALLFFVQDRHPEAEPYLRRAVEIDSLRTVPHTMLAHCLIEQICHAGDNYSEDMVSEVMDLLNRTLELDVVCGDAWYLWGRVQVMFRDFETAEKYLRAGIEHGTIHPECWALHALSLHELGRDEEADEVFQEFKRREKNMSGQNS